MRGIRRKYYSINSYIKLNYIYNNSCKAYIETDLYITDNTRIELRARIPPFTDDEISKDIFFAIGFTQSSDANRVVIGRTQLRVKGQIYAWFPKINFSVSDNYEDKEALFVFDVQKNIIGYNHESKSYGIVVGGKIVIGKVWNISSLKASDRSYYYGLKVWNGSKLVGDFIPVRHPINGKIGMLDTVKNKFYTSPNGAEFTGG